MRPRQPLLLPVFLMLLPLAGCLDNDAQTAPGTPPDPAGLEALPTSLRLAPDGSLQGPDATPPPATARSPLAWSTQDWLLGIDPPQWTWTPASPIRVLAANATIAYEAQAPAASPGDARPPLTAWFGSIGFTTHAFNDGPATVQPGDRFETRFDMRVPAGGLYVLPDAPLRLRLGDYYVQESQTLHALDVRLADSRIDLEAAPAHWPTTGPTTILDADGTLQGARCLAPLDVQGSATKTHALDVPVGTTALRATLTRTSGIVGPDVDFQVLAADGTEVSGSHGNGADEAILLGPANLAATPPQDWNVRIYACHPQSSTYRLQVEAWTDTA